MVPPDSSLGPASFVDTKAHPGTASSDPGQSEYARLGDPLADTVEANAADLAAQADAEAIKQIETISYLGVELPKGSGNEKYVPKGLDIYVQDQFTQKMRRDIATAWALHQPVYLEGGTALGKTTATFQMAHELGYSMYYYNFNGDSDTATMMGHPTANKHRTELFDPEFVHADGPIAAAWREAASGNKVVLMLDELGAGDASVLKRLNEVLDAATSGRNLNLTENDMEQIATVRENLHIVCASNPPSVAGSAYKGLEPFSPELMRRMVYLKMPDKLSDESADFHVNALFGIGETVAAMPDKAQRQMNDALLPHSELRKIDGMSEILKLYREFHKTASDLLARGTIAAKQPQKFEFDDRVEPQRVMEYVRRFFRGDISQTFQDALEFYYVNKVLSDGDKDALRKVITNVRYTPKPNARRQNFDPSSVGKPTGERWAPGGESRAMSYLSREFGRGKIDDNTLAELITGFTSPDAIKLREQLYASRNIGRALAGDDSAEAWAMRARLVSAGRVVEATESVTGIGNSARGSADSVRGAALADGSNDAMNAFMISLAGRGDNAAWADRQTYRDRASGQALLQSLTGLSTPASMLVRGEDAMFSRPNSRALARSLAGIDGQDAWAIRYNLIANGAHDEAAVSLAGLETPEALTLRGVLMDPGASLIGLSFGGGSSAVRQQIIDQLRSPRSATRPAALAEGLGGLSSPYAWDLRSLLQRRGASEAAIGRSLNGNWVAAAVAAGRRPTST